MSRGAQTFTQFDVTKAIKGAVKAGLDVKRVEIEAGKIVVFTGKPDEPQKAEPANEWDTVQ
jgi:hypothetical protein